ncbi:DUF2125 domain-containing protein [Tropicibacter oceani]|uniref:DUF2125 domain-containing protein n=1 Tax=Tropicibacter oceani TaxID=3058420 RepID=A0ABY8QJZ2_9RHOB|nr:DUF2125 domain-containing protein [Tropicibacter oceani]WGW04351.1 DUF2125 domain-containing protein [Tropicibacter oceani]
MKRLVLAISVAAILYAGFWALQAHNLRSGLERWFAERQQDGWDASYSDLSVRGFPNRLDVTLTDLVLANPDNQTTWRAPFFQMFSLVYRPEHWIFAWPDNQTVTTEAGEHQISSDGLRASLVIQDDRILRSNLEAVVLNISGPTNLAMAGLNLGVAVDDADPRLMRIGLNAAAIAGASGTLGPAPDGKIDEITLRAEVSFDEVWTRDALKSDKPQPTRIVLPLAEYKANKLELKATGDWEVDNKGRLDGTATLRAVNWRELLEGAGAAGDLPEGLADFLTQTMGLVASLSGNKTTLDLTFGFNDGNVSLGIIPLGKAPRIRLR